MMVVPYALASPLTAGPSTCDKDAVTGDGGCSKPKPTKDQRVFDGGDRKTYSIDRCPTGAGEQDRVGRNDQFARPAGPPKKVKANPI